MKHRAPWWFYSSMFVVASLWQLPLGGFVLMESIYSGLKEEYSLVNLLIKLKGGGVLFNSE